MGGIYFTIELLIAEALFGIYMPKRRLCLLRYIVGVAVCICAAYFIPTPSETWLFLLLILLFFALTMATQVVCLKTSVISYVFLGVASYTTQHLMAQMKNFLMLLYPLIGEGITKQLFERFMVVIAMCVIYTAVFFLFARKMKVQKLNMRTDKVRLLISSAIILIFSVVLSGYGAGIADTSYVIEKLYASVCCLLSLGLLYGLFNEDNLKKELEIIRQIQKEEKQHYSISRETIEAINMKCHDFKHQIYNIRKSNGKNLEFLEELEKKIVIYDSMLKTGNDALDVVLAEKTLLCEQNGSGIAFSCIIDGARLSFMKDSDIYSLFGNALDNAIEAVKELPDVNDRRIGFKVYAKSSFVCVHLQNKFVGEVSFRDDLPVTCKADKTMHGFGLKNIQMIVEKYGGSLSITVDENIFNLDVSFSLPQKAA